MTFHYKNTLEANTVMSKLALKSSILSRLNNNWNRFKSRLLLKYTLSYILIFLIPLTAVTIIIYENAINGLRSEIEQSNVNQLNQVKMTIDDRMSELQKIAGKIAYDEKLTPYMVRHPFYRMEAIRTLSNYTTNSSILEDLLLYFHDDSMIYSPRGLASLDVTFDQNYQFEHWSKEDMLHDLNEGTIPVMRPAELVNVNHRKESMLTLLVPIKPNDPYPHATVVYLMEESKLTGVMDSILNDFSGNSYIFDQNGEVLTANSHGEGIPEHELSVLANLQPGIHSLTLNNEKQSVVAVLSEENGWTYVTTMPSHQFFSRTVHIQSLILLVFGIVVLTGIAAAIMLAKRQYHPIRDLLEFAKMKSNGVALDSIKVNNEWEWIKQTINDYNTQIDMQEPYVRNQCLLLLLKHGKPDDPEIEKLISNAGLDLPQGQGYYFSVIVAWDESSHQSEMARQPRQQVQTLLNEVKIPDLHAHIYGIEFSHVDQFALMISLAPSDDLDLQQQIEQTVETLKMMVIDNSELLPSIGVGTLYENLADLNQSFIEAATALESRMLSGTGQVTYFEHLAEFTSDTETFWIPKKSMLKLEKSLKQGNESVSRQMISSIINDIKNESLSLSLVRCICFDLLNSLLRAASELGMNNVIQHIPSYVSFETLEELDLKLTGLASLICHQVEHNTESEQHSLMDDIVAYVDQQYADYTLSLEHIALKYAISTSYLSRSFKDKTGSNFSQYIWRCRMDQVCHLLLNTSAPLKDIIEQVGYLDTSNFIRKFKQEKGCTPGQYRSLYAPDVSSTTHNNS